MEKNLSLKVNTKVNSFQDVQKSLSTIEKQFNMLLNRINSPAEKELSERQGRTGDIQIVENADKSYSFEVRTKDGWKSKWFDSPEAAIEVAKMIHEDKPYDEDKLFHAHAEHHARMKEKRDQKRKDRKNLQQVFYCQVLWRGRDKTEWVLQGRLQKVEGI